MPSIIWHTFIIQFLLILSHCDTQDLDLHDLQKLRRIDAMTVDTDNGFSMNSSQELSEQWQNYYKCQNQEHKNTLHRHSIVEKIALPAFEGSHVIMRCKVCLSPRHSGKDIMWYIMADKEMQPLNVTGEEFHFDNLAIEQQGVYVCKFIDLVRKMYFLHVLYEPNEPIQQVRIQEEPHMREPTTHLMSDMGEVKLYSKWGNWSNCSEAHRCGHVGRRQKFGPCMISFEENFNLNAEKKAVMQIFPGGLPCRSSLVPLSIRLIKAVQERPSEIILGYCKVPCDRNANSKFEVWDNKGHLVDNVDNAEGLYSSLQDIPKPPPTAARNYIFPYDGDELTIKCPGYKQSDSPVKWHRGHKSMPRREIKESTKGRVTINILGHIIFQEIHLTDSNIYSCWQEGRLIGTIKLRVMTREVVMSKLHWSLFMAGAVLSSLLIAIYRIFKSGK